MSVVLVIVVVFMWYCWDLRVSNFGKVWESIIFKMFYVEGLEEF